MTSLLIFLAAIAAIIFYAIGIYNSLINLEIASKMRSPGLTYNSPGDMT